MKQLTAADAELAFRVTALVGRLADELEEAQSVFRDPRGKAGKLGVLKALTAVTVFLREIGGGQQQILHEPIEALLIAFIDMMLGHQPSLLTANARPGHRATDSREKTITKINAALGMELLMRAGMKKAAAAAKVANVLCKSGVTISAAGRQPRAATVAEWRHALMGHADDVWAARRFQNSLKLMLDHGPPLTMQSAERFLRRLPDIIPMTARAVGNLEKPPS